MPFPLTRPSTSSGRRPVAAVPGCAAYGECTLPAGVPFGSWWPVMGTAAVSAVMAGLDVVANTATASASRLPQRRRWTDDRIHLLAKPISPPLALRG
ncbi:MAG: hypothetical protein MZV70_30150 [Desulfobacterales bacterium]|nr:hypothetical protein [Desulfobacterales bacterium]